MIKPSKVPPQKSSAGQFVQCGEHTFALNYKAASTAFVRAIVNQYYPELEEKANELIRPHRLLPKVSPHNPVLIVRDPITRFPSACAQTDKGIDEAINEIKSLPVYNIHFWPTSRLLVHGIKLYLYESDLQAACEHLGLESLPLSNVSESLPELNQSQEEEVRKIYFDDIALHQSIKDAGQIWPSFESTMDKAFPSHLRGSISGCCDNMAEGHG